MWNANKCLRGRVGRLLAGGCKGRFRDCLQSTQCISCAPLQKRYFNFGPYYESTKSKDAKSIAAALESVYVSESVDFAESESKSAGREPQRVLVLDSDTCRSVFPMSAAIRSQRLAFVSEHIGDSHTPSRLIMNVGGNNDTLFKPCLCGDALSLKVVSVRTKLPLSAFVALMHARSGQLQALLDGNFLTGRRTAAASAVATDLCARKDAKVCTVFGAGVQGVEHIRAMLSVRPSLEFVYLVDLSLTAANAVTEAMTEALAKKKSSHAIGAVEFKCLQCLDGDAIHAAIGESDVVCTCTPSTAPLFDGSWLKEGVHMNCIGAYKADMREIDSKALLSCAQVTVDSQKATHCGDLCHTPDLDSAKLSTIGALLTRAVEGGVDVAALRAANTLYDGVGFAAMDLFAAQFIYDRALEAKKGVVVTL